LGSPCLVPGSFLVLFAVHIPCKHDVIMPMVLIGLIGRLEEERPDFGARDFDAPRKGDISKV
jgi:hypothetical protein